jgi:hypothetical protein
MRATVFDRYGRRIEDDDVVPDGGFVRVPLPFMDALSVRTNRAFLRDSVNKPLVLDLLGAPAGHRPGYVVPTDDEYDDTARQRYIQRLTNAWRTSTCDNAEGANSADLPADIAALPMMQQQAYCAAYNQYMEENPEADEEECDAAGRAAIEPRDSADAAANLEAVRAAYQAEYVRRISNAWKK